MRTENEVVGTHVVGIEVEILNIIFLNCEQNQESILGQTKKITDTEMLTFLVNWIDQFDFLSSHQAKW